MINGRQFSMWYASLFHQFLKMAPVSGEQSAFCTQCIDPMLAILSNAMVD